MKETYLKQLEQKGLAIDSLNETIENLQRAKEELHKEIGRLNELNKCLVETTQKEKEHNSYK